MTEQEWLASNDPQAMLNHLRGKASDRKLRLFAVACCRRIWHLLTDDVRCEGCYGAEQHGAAGRGNWKMSECPHCGGTGRINRSRRAVEAAERYADGLITVGELTAARDAAVAMPVAWDAAVVAAKFAAWIAAWNAAVAAVWVADRDAAWDAEKTPQAALLRDICGNPFRPLGFECHRCGGDGKAHGSDRPFEWSPDPDYMKCPVCKGDGRSEDVRLWLRWHSGTIPRMAQQMYESRDFSAMPILADALEDAGCTNEDILMHCRQPGEHVRGCWVVDLILGKE